MLWRVAGRLLWIAASVLLVASYFFPWISEAGHSQLAISNPLHWSVEYWSWKSETQLFRGAELQRFYTTSLQEYWFGHEHPPVQQHIWLMTFVVQLAAYGMAMLGILKDRIMGIKLPLYGVFSASTLILALGYFQRFLITEDGGSSSSLRVHFRPGFFLVVCALLLWSALMLAHLSWSSGREKQRKRVATSFQKRHAK